MERHGKKTFSIVLVVVIMVTASLIVLKTFEGSYALPTVEDPKLISVVNSSSNSVKLTYNLSNVEPGYKVSVYKDSVKTYDITSFQNGDNSYDITGLEKGKVYSFYIEVCDSDDLETRVCGKSEIKTIEIPKDQPVAPRTLGKINSITLVKSTSSTLTVRWNKAENASSYTIKYKGPNGKEYTHTNIKATSCNIKSLKANSKYYISVIAINNSLLKNNNNWYTKSFWTDPSVPNIRGFKADISSSTKIELSWKKIKNKKISYVIYRSTNNKNWTKIRTFNYKKTSYVDKKLNSKKTYYYKMQPVYKGKNKNFYGNFTSVKKISLASKNKGTYVLVSIKKQKIWFYKKGKLILKSNVVTGRKGVTNTPKGTYSIRGKSRSAYLVGDDYVSFVNYWMLIDSGHQIGLHDATWRSKFGGSIYKYNGSHGCINLPMSVAKKIYKKAQVGTRVIVK